MEYTLEDGKRVSTGDAAFNYYDMRPGHIGWETGNNWFMFEFSDERGGTAILNGQRCCSLEHAARKGWLPPADERLSDGFRAWCQDTDPPPTGLDLAAWVHGCPEATH